MYTQRFRLALYRIFFVVLVDSNENNFSILNVPTTFFTVATCKEEAYRAERVVMGKVSILIDTLRIDKYRYL